MENKARMTPSFEQLIMVARRVVSKTAATSFEVHDGDCLSWVNISVLSIPNLEKLLNMTDGLKVTIRPKSDQIEIRIYEKDGKTENGA